MEHFVGNIEKLTLENNDFRKIIKTASNLQLVVMSIKPNKDIGIERHINVDQFIRIEKGKAIALLVYGNDGNWNPIWYKLYQGDVIIIPKGTYHNIINFSDTEDLKLYTIYSPPEH